MFTLLIKSVLFFAISAAAVDDGPALVPPTKTCAAWSAPIILPKRKPVRWRIGEIDDRFNLTKADLLAAVSQAIFIWEEEAGTELFEYDPKNGFPINLVYDHRQERVDQENRAAANLKGMRESLTLLKEKIERQRSNLRVDQASLERDWRSHDEKVAAYNRLVGYWNAQGGAPAEVKYDLDEKKKALQREESWLRIRETELESAVAECNRAVDEHNALVERISAAKEAFTSKYGNDKPVKVGECVRDKSSVKRISVFVVFTQEDLASTIAHELGHAIGLQHVKGSGSLMSAVDDGEQFVSGVKLTVKDKAELRRVLKG